jgi:hypothetical protein
MVAKSGDGMKMWSAGRLRCDASLTRDRFMQVDPTNRLVADALEANWNERLRALTDD